MATNTSAVVSRPEVAVCPVCNGTGWKPLKNKRVAPCECKVESRIARLLQQAAIPRRYDSCTIASYVTGGNSSCENAKLKAEEFSRLYPAEKKGLMFVGRPGVGKTHLAVGIIRELVTKKQVSCLFCDYRELLENIKNSYDASSQTSSMEVLRPVFESEVLVLDDLGAVVSTGWVWDTVSLILNRRYKDERTTIITTNFPDGPAAGALASDSDTTLSGAARRANREQTLGDRITERMRSRVHEMCKVVTLWDVPDFRDSTVRARAR